MTAHDVRILRGAAVGIGAASPLLLLVAGVVAGLGGVVAAAAGLVVVTAFFTLGILAIAWAERVSPELMLPLTAFVIKLTMLGLLLAVAPEAELFSRTTFAVSVGLGALVWVHVQAYRVWSAKLLYVTMPKQG